MKADDVKKAYTAARELYAEAGIDTEQVLSRLQQSQLSGDCWLSPSEGMTTAEMLRRDVEKATLDVPACDAVDIDGIVSGGNYGVSAEATTEQRLSFVSALVRQVRGVQQRMLREMLGNDQLPWQAVYDEFCYRNNVPVADEYIYDIEKYLL